MIPLLIDAGIARGTAVDLRALGWDVVHVSDIGLGDASDPSIIDTARLRAEPSSLSTTTSLAFFIFPPPLPYPFCSSASRDWTGRQRRSGFGQP